MLWLNNQPTDSTGGVNKEIAIFPNPASNKVYVVTSLNSNEVGVVAIFDINGIKVKEIKVGGGTTTNTLLTDNLSDGIYLYCLTTNEQYTARGKLAIAR